MLCLRLAENCATSRWIFHLILIFEKWPNIIKMSFDWTCRFILTEYNNLKCTQFQPSTCSWLGVECPFSRYFKLLFCLLFYLKFSIFHIFECILFLYLNFSASLLYQCVGKKPCSKEMTHPPNLKLKCETQYLVYCQNPNSTTTQLNLT